MQPPRPRPSRAWLVPVLVLAAFALAGPTVIAKRQADLHRPATTSYAQAGQPAAGKSTPAAGNATVDMADIAFKPATLVVRKGTKVLFTNHDVAPHTVTADSGAIDSGIIPPGGSFSLEISANLKYHCTVHPSMTASIVVAA